MKDRSNTTPNPFGERRDEVLAVAAEIYRAETAGVDPDPMYSAVSPINLAVSGDPKQIKAELRREETLAAELTGSARAAARFASLVDQKERGGLAGAFARFELMGSKVMQAKEFRQAMEPGGIVDSVRLAARF